MLKLNCLRICFRFVVIRSLFSMVTVVLKMIGVSLRCSTSEVVVEARGYSFGT